jgi:aromatase
MTRSVTGNRTVNTTHTVFVAAPPRAVYDLIADVTRWPYIFSPTVHVQRLYGSATDDRLRLWTVANGGVRSWTSRRTLDQNELRIRFRQENPLPPVATMAGEWVFIPLPDNATSVVLLHEFRAVGDDPTNTALITQAVDHNSTVELAALKTTAELGERRSMLVHSFADSVTIDGEPGPVYDFLHRAQDWPRRLPHVSRLTLDESVPNVQTIELDAKGTDGSVHTSRLIRVCFPYESIVYKQTELPEILTAHIGRLRVYQVAAGVRVTSQQTVMIRPDRLPQLLGPNGTVERASEVLRRTLGANSLLILQHAKQAVEGRPARRVVVD